MINRNNILIAGFLLCNLAALGLLNFTDILVLRIIGWLWLGIALTAGGLVEIGGMFGVSGSDLDEHG